ncbi:MAG: hypothetical protein WC451_03200 [Patescibacteria group bacterium]|jgi:hypothetical protein
MKVRVNQTLLQRDGKPIIDNAGREDAQEASLRIAIINSLESILDTDRNEQPIKKYERSKLADKVYAFDEVEFTVEEIAMIKERIGKLFGPYVVKLCWDMLENKEITPTEN